MRADSTAALLKVAHSGEEARGARLMAWWSATSSTVTAPVLRQSDAALLMVRGEGAHDLTCWSRAGRSEQALALLGDLAARLPLDVPPARVGLVPLERWFAALLDRSDGECTGSGRDIIRQGRELALDLLASSEHQRVLHGDLHHGNVVDFAPAGASEPDFRAIDPKGLVGDPAFDGVAAVLNPDRNAPPDDPGRLRARAQAVSARLEVATDRLLAWVQAFTALSAVWVCEQGTSADSDLAWSRLAQRAR